MPKMPRPDHQLGDAPIQSDLIVRMNALARVIDEALNGDARGAERKNGFVLLAFPFGHDDGARCNFISNGADRKEIVTLFKEMIARFEGQPELKGRA